MQVETASAVVPAAEFPGRQGRLAFARLALSPSPVPRSELADVVWPGRLAKSWERDLSAVVSKVRSVLVAAGIPDPVHQALGCYQLRLGPDSSVDVLDAMRFVEDAEAEVARGDLRAAHGAISVAHEHLLRPFLPGETGDWVEGRRDERHQLLARALAAFVEIDIRRGVFPEGRRLALQLIDLEPYRESSYAALMRLQIAAGDRADALKTYTRARTMFIDELGVTPGDVLEQTYQQALQADGTDVAADRLPSGLVVFVFTDMVGSTAMLETLGSAAANDMRRGHYVLVRELLAMHGGHEVKALGDGFMLAFSSVSDAVRFAVALQRAVTSPVSVRIGIDVGEPVLENGDYHGTPVVVAQRLCDAASAGGVLVSEAIRLLATPPMPTAERVELQLKGLSQPRTAWSISY